MADFTLRPTSGVTVVDWFDEATGAHASRLNAEEGFPHRNYQAPIGTAIVVKATVGGVEGEIDSNLGGRLFLHWFTEHPTSPPAITSGVGFSSVATFIPTIAGNYLLTFYRAGGGSVSVPIEVVPAVAP
jgi:hypothetical protein